MIPPILLDPTLVSPDRLSQVSREARLLFLLLGDEVDHFGRFDADPEAIRSRLYPHDDDLTEATVAAWLLELSSAEFIRRTPGDSPDTVIVGWLRDLAESGSATTG